MTDRNPFGGRNPHGMYVPLTDDELEVLARLADAGEFSVVIKDWGVVTGFKRGSGESAFQGQPLVVFGDKRVSFYFEMLFEAPAKPQPCWYFDMEVWALGHRLFPGLPSESNPYPGRFPTTVTGSPLQIVAGLLLGWALDVALDKIDPAFVREVKPKATGLTTRHGNMRLNQGHQRLLADLREGERKIRGLTVREAQDVTRRSEGRDDDPSDT